MDGQRFDRITKSLAIPGSRRRLVKGLAAGAVTAVTGALLRGGAEAAQVHTCCCFTCTAVGLPPYCRCQRTTFCEARSGCINTSVRTVSKCSACSFPT
jgi:hypothetical protein